MQENYFRRYITDRCHRRGSIPLPHLPNSFKSKNIEAKIGDLYGHDRSNGLYESWVNIVEPWLKTTTFPNESDHMMFDYLKTSSVKDVWRDAGMLTETVKAVRTSETMIDDLAPPSGLCAGHYSKTCACCGSESPAPVHIECTPSVSQH